MLILVTAISSSSSAAISLRPSLVRMRKGGILAASCAAGVCAGYELRESFHELGHHHGVALIALSKVAHAISLLEVASLETREELGMTGPKRQGILRRVARFIYGCNAVRWLCVAALFAALYEVYVDLRPGGHHGTALLALAEFRETTEHAIANRGGFLRVLFSSAFTKVVLGLAAFVFAVVELVRDSLLNVGAHHGVALLALAYVFKNGGEVLTVLVDRQLRKRK